MSKQLVNMIDLYTRLSLVSQMIINVSRAFVGFFLVFFLLFRLLATKFRSLSRKMASETQGRKIRTQQSKQTKVVRSGYNSHALSRIHARSVGRASPKNGMSVAKHLIVRYACPSVSPPVRSLVTDGYLKFNKWRAEIKGSKWR